MSEKERERLIEKELKNNPGGALNNTWTQAYTGSPSSGCLINIGSIAMIVVFILIVRACSN